MEFLCIFNVALILCIISIYATSIYCIALIILFAFAFYLHDLYKYLTTVICSRNRYNVHVCASCASSFIIKADHNRKHFRAEMFAKRGEYS